MKKFTLLATVATIATIGCTFAAWQFAGPTINTSIEGDPVSVIIDDSIVTSGLSGTLTITKATGNGTIKMKQSDDNPYGLYFVDETDSNAETFTVTYTAGVGEQVQNYIYKVDIKFEIYYNNNLLSKVGTASYTLGNSQDFNFNASNVASFSQDLLPLNAAVSNDNPITNADLGISYENNATAFKNWISTLDSNSFKIKVSAILSYDELNTL